MPKNSLSLDLVAKLEDQTLGGSTDISLKYLIHSPKKVTLGSHVFREMRPLTTYPRKQGRTVSVWFRSEAEMRGNEKGGTVAHRTGHSPARAITVSPSPQGTPRRWSLALTLPSFG